MMLAGIPRERKCWTRRYRWPVWGSSSMMAAVAPGQHPLGTLVQPYTATVLSSKRLGKMNKSHTHVWKPAGRQSHGGGAHDCAGQHEQIGMRLAHTLADLMHQRQNDQCGNGVTDKCGNH